MEVGIRCTLIALLLLAMATCMWANSRMMRRAQDVGYRYWLINPMSAFAGARGIELPIFLVACLTAVVAVMGLVALKGN